MKVNDLNIYSDHCMLSTKIKIGSTLGYDEDSCSDNIYVNCFTPDMYIWSESSKNKFQDAFSSLDIQNRLNKLDSMIQSSENDVNNLVKAITDVITCAGDMSLLRKRIKRKKTKKHRINKKWYDQDCFNMLRDYKTAKMLLIGILQMRFMYYVLQKKLKPIKD